MKIIQLDSLKNITVIPEKKIQADSIVIQQIIDNPNAKSVTAILTISRNNTFRLTLWEMDAYDSIGDWTQQQAEQRIVDLL